MVLNNESRVIMKNISITKLTWCLTLLLVLFSSCKDDELEGVARDVFRPKIISGIVEGNIIKLYWYEVLDGISYTIQISDNEQFTNILDEETTESLSYITPRMPYDTKFYIRLRTNAKSEENNSIWRVMNITTPKRTIQPILKEVNPIDILETAVVLKWDVDSKYPADHLIVQALDKVDDGTIPDPIEINLSEEQYLAGELNVENLLSATNYKATIYNNQAEDVFERPYNSITFKTAGPPEGAKVITSTDDLNSILLSDKDNVDIQDGQIYYIRGGGIFEITGFEFKKGFQIVGAPGIKTVINVTSAFTPVANAGKLGFANINLTGVERLITNQENDGKDYVWSGLEMTDCNITGFANGFILIQTSANNMKMIQGIYVDNCVFDGMQGGRFIESNNFSDASVMMIQIEKIVVTNTTFMNSPKMLFLFLPDAYGSSGSTIDLTMRNVTVFEALGRAGNNRTIQMNRLTNQSKVSISKCLFSNDINASNDQYMFYETCLCGSAVTSYADNYITGTRDETGRKGVSAKKLNLSQNELFFNPSEGNLNIKNVSSVIYLEQIGDPRWMK